MTIIQAICFFASLLARPARGADLVHPPEVSSSGGVLNAVLTIEALSYTSDDSATSFVTRAINGSIPGPTLRISAGDTLNIDYYNMLGYDCSATGSGCTHSGTNGPHYPNVTNLHTHGLHVSSASPADDVFTSVSPGGSFSFSYAIPSYHMGGTHWYHPHHHGSTSVQAGGGAVGMIIVEDASSEIPPEFANATEVILVMTHVDSDGMATQEQASGGSLWQVSGTAMNNVLVNGQGYPDIDLITGKWYRFRMVFAAVESILRLGISSTACEVLLIAKDGVYLQEIPRTISAIHLWPGARADVMVRCTTAGSYTLASAEASGRPAASNRAAHRPPGGGGFGGGGSNVWTGDIASITVTDDSSTADADLSTYTINRPCYLVDLTSATPTNNDFTLEFQGGATPMINGASFVDSTTYVTTMASGTMNEWAVDGNNGHPFHLHINPYQIADTSLCGDDLYVQNGDWHDTLLLGSVTVSGASPTGTTVRFQTDSFTGKMVIHCHILEHEDDGMMAVSSITGTEGAVWSTASVIDSSCYTTSGGRGYQLGTWAGRTCSSTSDSTTDDSNAVSLRRCSWHAMIVSSFVLTFGFHFPYFY